MTKTNSKAKHLIVMSAVLFSMTRCTWDLPDYWQKTDADVDSGTGGDAGGDSDAAADTDTDTDIDAGLDSGLGDGGSGAGTDADTDCDGDTDSECEEDAGTDTDSDTDTDMDSDTDADTDTDTTGGPPDEWDGDIGDYHAFCGNPDYGKYTDKEGGFIFDNAGAPYQGEILNPEVEITEFSYFNCPYCADAAAMMEELFSDPSYSDRAIYYYANFYWYDDTSKPGWDGHKAAHAAHRQGRYWPMRKMIFEAEEHPEGEEFFAFAEELGVDMETFTSDFYSQDTADYLLADRTEGVAAGVTGTPTFFINGHKVCKYEWIEEDNEWQCLNTWSKVQDILDCLFGY